MLLPRFTNAGKALQLAALDGEEIIFTKIQMGSGVLTSDYKTLTALVEPKVTVPITKISVTDGYASVRGYFSNAELAEGFYYRELGLWARDPDDSSAEILYCYGNTGDTASYISEPSSALIEKSIKIIAVVDDAENVSAVINGSAVYVDFTELQSAIDSHNESPSAHANLVNQTVNFYVNCNSVEASSMRDGTAAHPFKTIDEAHEAIPDYARTLRITIAASGDYTGNSIYFGIGDSSHLENLHIQYLGTVQSRPVIKGGIHAFGLNNVWISNIRFASQVIENNVVPMDASISLQSCERVRIDTVSASYASGDDFAIFQKCNVVMTNCSVLNAQSGLSLSDASCVYMKDVTVNVSGCAISCDASSVYLQGTSSVEAGTVVASNKGLIVTPTTIEKITDGSILSHLISTANPHNTSLTQAQAAGGTINVAHGGTGQTTLQSGAILKGAGTSGVGAVRGAGALFAPTAGNPQFGTLPASAGGTGKASNAAGALLKGNGTSALEELIGTGALFSAASGSPQFGTLPVNMGGTGRTNTGVTIADNESAYGCRGAVELVGGIVIQWGKALMAESNTTTNFLVNYANADYVLVFTTWDATFGNPDKSTTSFTLQRLNGLTTVVSEWIAIGRKAT